MSLTLATLKVYLSQAVQQLLATAPATTPVVSCLTENLVVYLKNEDAFVFNVVGSPLIQAAAVSVALPVTSDSSGSSTTVGMTSTAGLSVGMFVFGAGIASGTIITAISTNTSITLNIAAVTVTNQVLTFAAGQLYFDGTTYRDDISASFAGAPDKVLGVSSGTSLAVSLSTYVGKSDRLGNIPPRQLGKIRNQVVFYRYDTTGLPLGVRWVWADLVIGIGDAPRQYPN